jgi:hypothetical protein
MSMTNASTTCGVVPRPEVAQPRDETARGRILYCDAMVPHAAHEGVA